MKILVINGPNLNMLGVREPSVYGTLSYAGLVEYIKEYAEENGVIADVIQTNYEGELCGFIQKALGVYDGIIINPGAFTHYSYAVLDALLAVNIPAVEVHVSNIHKREGFRRKSVTARGCVGQVSGLGVKGYRLAMDYFIENPRRKNKNGGQYSGDDREC